MIRQMTIADYEDVYNFWINIPGMGLNDIDDSREGIAKYLERNPHTCFVATEQDRIVGVILSGHDGRRGYIYHAAVDAAVRKRGIGTALLKAAMDALKAEGVCKVALFVFAKNSIGNGFWEKRGFVVREDLNYRNKAIAELKRIDT